MGFEKAEMRAYWSPNETTRGREREVRGIGREGNQKRKRDQKDDEEKHKGRSCVRMYDPRLIISRF